MVPRSLELPRSLPQERNCLIKFRGVIECADALDGFSRDSNRWGGRNVIQLFERSSFRSAAVVLTIKCGRIRPILC
jgi:hypothetical protein